MIPARPAADFRVDTAVIMRIALPMTLAFLSTPLLGAVDTGVVGQFGEAALIGGIAVGALVFDVLFSMFNFLRSGTTGLTAQAVGAGDRNGETLALLRALAVALVAGLLMIAAAGPLLALAVAFIAPGDAVAEATARYFDIRIVSAPFALANYALLGWLLGQGRAGLGLALQILLNGTNIGLSILFGLGYGWGIEGVAWGTVVGEVVAALTGASFALAAVGSRLPALLPQVFERTGFARMMTVNRDIMIRSLALLFAFALFTRIGAGFGDVTLAANAILMNFFLVGGYFLDGLATAAEQLTGRAIGARRADPFRRAVRLTFLWSLVFSAALSLAFLLGGEAVIRLMTTAPEVRSEALAFLLFAVVTPLAGAAAFQLDGVFIGATWSVEMRNMMLASVVLFLLCLAVLVPLFGNAGLWTALLVFLGARGVSLALRLRPLTRRAFPSPSGIQP